MGVVVPDTRAWRLEPFRGTHPLVEALLTWRKAERIATTYGWSWLDAHVGADDRLRGGWSACDGAAGRMTAQNGLHNLPAAAAPGRRGGTRVTSSSAPTSGRSSRGCWRPSPATRPSPRPPAPTTSTPPWRAALKVERPVAKVAVLAAMYGQTSGAAGEALKDLERAYPTAMAYLRRAYDEGVAARAVHTFGGRRVPMWRTPDGTRAGRGGRRRRRAWAVRPQRGDPGRRGRAVQGVGGHGAVHHPRAWRADRPVPARRAAPARARGERAGRWPPRSMRRCPRRPGAGPAPTP